MTKIKIREYAELQAEIVNVGFQTFIDLLQADGFVLKYKQGYITTYRNNTKQSEKMLSNYLHDKTMALTNSQTPLNLPISIVSILASTEWQFETTSISHIHANPLPPEAVTFCKPYIRWSSMSTGEQVFLVRTSEKFNCWEITTSPEGDLARQKRDDGTTYMDYLSELLKAKQMAGEIAWGVTQDEDQKTGIVSIIHTPFMVLISEEKFKSAFKKERTLYLPIPTTFTNDPETPSSCCFPLTTLPTDPKPEQYEAWLDFESQMPPWSIPMWRASFYGIFDDTNRSRQMIIMHDNGQTGKSNFIRAITKVTSNNFYTAISKDSLSNNFWGSKIIGRRLVFFSDTGNQKVTQMDKIKQISGGDPIDVELKGISGQIHYTPNIRLIITTNSRPEINTYNKHQLSRVLIFPLTATKDPAILKKFCKLDDKGEVAYNEDGEPIVVGAPYDTWMAEQFYFYLAACKPDYDKLCPKRQDIIVSNDMLNYIKTGCVSSTTDALNYMMATYLDLQDDNIMPNYDLRLLASHISGTVQDPDLDFEVLQDYLLTIGCSRSRLTQKNQVVRGVKGVQFKPGYSIVNDRVIYKNPSTQGSSGYSGHGPKTYGSADTETIV
jgi:hypothetical protein